MATTKVIAACSFIALSLFMVGSKAIAQTSTVSATPATTSSNLKQVESLKERLATKVAEMRQTQKKAVTGSVKEITTTAMTLTTTAKDLKIEMTDELTVIQYLKGKRTTLAEDDISKGDNVVIFGDYDSALDIIQAKIVFIEPTTQNQRVSGIVTDINRTDYTLTIKTRDNKSYVIDIEGTTKTNIWTKSDGMVKSGYSKINSGDNLEILGVKTTKEDNRLSAVRILDLRDLSGNPAVSITPTVTATATATPKLSPTP